MVDVIDLDDYDSDATECSVDVSRSTALFRPASDDEIEFVSPPARPVASAKQRKQITPLSSKKSAGKKRARSPPSDELLGTTRVSSNKRARMGSSSAGQISSTQTEAAQRDGILALRLFAELNGLTKAEAPAYISTLNDKDSHSTLSPMLPAVGTSASTNTTGAGRQDDDHSEQESDSQLARRTAREFEEQERRVRKQEEDDALYVQTLVHDEELAQKRARAARAASKANESKIAFQVTMDSEGKTLEGDEDADNATHLALVKRDFEGAGAGLRIKKITYFVNFALNERFEAAKVALAEQKRDTTERTLFHGTSATNIQPILENGFHVGGVGGAKIVNGAACGIGVYLAASPMTSFAYCGGCLKMFACRVVTGRATMRTTMQAPKKHGKNDFDAYDNGAGSFVARHPDQVLPRYIVEFEAAPGHAGLAAGLPLIGATRGVPNFSNVAAAWNQALGGAPIAGYPVNTGQPPVAPSANRRKRAPRKANAASGL